MAPITFTVEDCGYDTPCWLWQGCTNNSDYGQLRDPRVHQAVPAHRHVYELVTGFSVPDDLTVDHLCLTKRCVNPRHMEIVSARINTQRRTGNKLTPELVTEIRHASGLQRDIAEAYGISQSNVSRIRNGRIWLNDDGTQIGTGEPGDQFNWRHTKKSKEQPNDG